MGKLSFAPRGVGIAALAVLALAGLAPSLAFAEDVTNITECTAIGDMIRLAGDNEQQAAAARAKFNETGCNEIKTLDSFKKPATQEVKNALANPMDQADSNTRAIDSEAVDTMARERLKKAGQDVTQGYDACKRTGSESRAACILVIQQVFGEPNNIYSQLMEKFQGTNVEAACSQISSYQSAANSARSKAMSQCENNQNTCQKTCDLVEYTVQSLKRGNPNLTFGPWDLENRAAGYQSCSAIASAKDDLQNQINTRVSNLQNACNAAREQAKKKQAKNDEEKKDTKNDSLMNQVGQALPAIASALGASQAPIYPGVSVDGTPVTSEPAYNMNPGMAPTIGKSGQVPSGSSPSSIPLGEDLTLGGTPEGYQKSKLNAIPQQPGGGAAPQGGGGGPNASNDPKRRGGGKSRLDKDIYSGFLGGGAQGSGRSGVMSFDDNVGPGGKKLGGGVPGLPGQMASMDSVERFRPTWFARREIATVTGPDGITGPHTNIFRKVRTRYNEVPLELSVLGK